MTKQSDELAALKKKVEELEAKLSPPKPFVPQPYERYDPTAGMCMPPSALAAMVNAVPDRVLRDIVHDNRGPRTPTGTIPRSEQLTGGGGPANVLHAVLCEALTNTQALLTRLEAGVTVPRNDQREIIRLLYVATRHQVKALTACLEIEGLE
jgi:hypothetical protein